MMNDGDNHQDESDRDKRHISMDTYGIKAQIPLGRGDDYNAPTSWPEVLERVQRAVMKMTTLLFELPAEVGAAVVMACRGSAKIPSAVEKRISSAHEQADKSEDEKQIALLTQPNPTALPVPPQLNAILERYREQGIHAVARVAEDGTVFVYVIPPASVDEVMEITDGSNAAVEPDV
jgi:hypothetical protein